MINKISSRSECFDIFVAKMMQPKTISKRAGISSFVDEIAASGARIMKSLGPKIEELVSDARIPLMFIEDASDRDVIRLGESLMSVRAVPAITDDILGVAKRIYPEATTYDEFLDLWMKDFSAMSKELDLADGKLTAIELDALYIKHKKSIDAYKLLKESATVNRALSAENIAKGIAATNAAKAAAAAKAGLKPASTAEEIAAAAGKAGKGAAALAFGGKALGLLPLAGVGYGAWLLGSYLLGSDEVENELDKIAAAIKCIDSIQLTSGSPAAKDRLIIINNLKAYLAADATSKAAQESLCADATTEGSIAHFVSLISSDPGANLSGFASWQKTDAAIAALAGGAAGFALGGLLGAAIGAAAAGGAGWFFISTYYKDQLNCLSGAVDAIASISRLAAAQAGGSDNTHNESPEGTSGPVGTSTPEASILAKILMAMAENKLVGKRGPNLINEKEMVNRLLKRATSPEIAAVALIQSNYNIATRVKSDSIQNIIGAIDRGAVRANQELKDLMQDVIDTIPNAIRALEQGSIITSSILHTRSNNMKKLSISTNTGTIKKKAEETKASYFGDASSGLQDSLTKSYYAGLTGMYNEKLPSRSSDYKDLYGFQEETGGDLVLQSHSKSVTLADAMGKGGLVENGLEQQEKSNYIATSTPTGNFQSKYAQTLNYLTKLAKAADNQGKKDVSQLINKTIKTLN